MKSIVIIDATTCEYKSWKMEPDWHTCLVLPHTDEFERVLDEAIKMKNQQGNGYETWAMLVVEDPDLLTQLSERKSHYDGGEEPGRAFILDMFAKQYRLRHPE